MASYSPKLLEKKYNNWVKAHLAVLITKEGLETFVCDEIQQFQSTCLDDIWSDNGLKRGTLCSSCFTENICITKRNASLQFIGTCPNRICHKFNLAIKKNHRYYFPSYKNTDTSQWCSNFWEVAKCFMPPDGYKDKVCAAETDFNGIISIILNHIGFQGKIYEDLQDETNVFKAVREFVNNCVRHSPKLEVEDSDLQELFKLLQKLLSDRAYLANDKYAQHASKKLTQLKNDIIVISKDDERKALDDAEKAIHDKRKIESDEQCDRNKLDVIKRKLEDKEQHGVEDLENSKGKKRKSENDRRTEKKIKRQENNVDICFGGDDNDCHESNDNNNDNNYASIALVGDEIQTALNLADFKGDLKQWYRKNLVSLPLSVTDDTIDTTLESLYVKQELSEHTTGKLKKIESLKDLFTPNDKVALEIFLCSIVGAGNTTFAKYLTNLWCQSDLCDIDFVFPLNLTDSLDECNTEDMIYQQIIQNLPCEPSFKGNKSLLTEILKSNRCLIILDESDRWRHPTNGCTKPLKKIPHRFASDNIIVLTIARQRKLIRMKNTQIDKVIVINCLGNESKKQLQINALKGITEIQEKREIVEENLLLSQQKFQNDISHHNLHELESVPLIVMHLVCLWWDGALKRMSTCEVYDSIIVMLLSRTLKYFQPSDLNQQQKSGFTEILEGLRKLASNSPRESETIARSLVNRYLKKEQAELCLLSGIFSESNGKLCSEENSLEICFTFENVREHFMQVRV